MGIFNKLKDALEPHSIARPEPEKMSDKLSKPDVTFHFLEEGERAEHLTRTVKVNISKKACRISFEAEELKISNARLEQDGDKIRCVADGSVVFEIYKNTKAYNELFEYVGHNARTVTLKLMTGDYGPYYRVILTYYIIPE